MADNNQGARDAVLTAAALIGGAGVGAGYQYLTTGEAGLKGAAFGAPLGLAALLVGHKKYRDRMGEYLNSLAAQPAKPKGAKKPIVTPSEQLIDEQRKAQGDDDQKFGKDPDKGALATTAGIANTVAEPFVHNQTPVDAYGNAVYLSAINPGARAVQENLKLTKADYSKALTQGHQSNLEATAKSSNRVNNAALRATSSPEVMRQRITNKASTGALVLGLGEVGANVLNANRMTEDQGLAGSAVQQAYNGLPAQTYEPDNKNYPLVQESQRDAARQWQRAEPLETDTGVSFNENTIDAYEGSTIGRKALGIPNRESYDTFRQQQKPGEVGSKFVDMPDAFKDPKKPISSRDLKQWMNNYSADKRGQLERVPMDSRIST